MKLFVISLSVFFLQSPELVRHNIGEDISVKIPENFTPVSEGQMINRHVHFRSPLAFYTDPDNDVDLSFNQNPTQWREADIAILKDFYKSNILSLYDEVEFSQEEIVDIRGRKFVVFEFVSTLKADENSIRNSSPIRKYTYIQYTIFKGSTFVANFTSSYRSKPQWSPIARKIMGSIAFK